MSPMHTKRFALLTLLLIAMWSMSASAQVDVSSATLKGTITDQLGAVVSGANVTATSLEKGIARSVTTGDEGTFQIALLPPGVYKVEIDARGFKKMVNENVQLSVGQSRVIDVQLTPETVREQAAI